MSIQTKKGFTLIELMVVIVIIGILAAIAIPKLFGMTAKAKASEVGPASGTWSKMQLAYVMERSDLGTYEQISYKTPGKDSKTGSFDYTEPNKAGEWQAKTEAKLTDVCVIGKTWNVKFTGPNNDGPDEAQIGCYELTPNFCAILPTYNKDATTTGTTDVQCPVVAATP